MVYNYEFVINLLIYFKGYPLFLLEISVILEEITPLEQKITIRNFIGLWIPNQPLLRHIYLDITLAKILRHKTR